MEAKEMEKIKSVKGKLKIANTLIGQWCWHLPFHMDTHMQRSILGSVGSSLTALHSFNVAKKKKKENGK